MDRLGRGLRFGALAILLIVTGCAGLQAPREYSVFFRNDEATLTPEAQQLVVEIAGHVRDMKPAKIVVAGTADGGTAHDAALADQRASVVLHALVDQGVPAGSMSQQVDVPPPASTGVAAHRVVVRFLP